MKREFKIPGKVQAKQRPRMNLHNGRVYTPQTTVNYENYVKWCYSDNIFTIFQMEIEFLLSNLRGKWEIKMGLIWSGFRTVRVGRYA